MKTIKLTSGDGGKDFTISCDRVSFLSTAPWILSIILIKFNKSELFCLG